MYNTSFKFNLGGVFLLFEDALEEFLMELEIKNYSKKTIVGYKFNNKQLMNFLNTEFDVQEIEK